MPELSERCVVSLANEEYNKTDDEEGHETAFHDVCLCENDGIKGLLGNGYLLLDGIIQISGL